jgi:hypothetical protein
MAVSAMNQGAGCSAARLGIRSFAAVVNGQQPIRHRDQP